MVYPNLHYFTAVEAPPPIACWDIYIYIYIAQQGCKVEAASISFFNTQSAMMPLPSIAIEAQRFAKQKTSRSEAATDQLLCCVEESERQTHHFKEMMPCLCIPATTQTPGPL